MTGTIAEIWRHPIKSHGRERVEQVSVKAGATLPWDRYWAVAHEHAKAVDGSWSPCVNFSRGAKVPALMALTARMDEENGTVQLAHPDLGTLGFDPDTEAHAFLDWIRPIMPSDRAQSTRILRADRGMTDTPFPSISFNSIASHKVVEGRAKQKLSHLRWRGNIWIDGLDPWQEFEWVGKALRVGTAEIAIRERIGRCRATTADPLTGKPDVDTLAILRDTIGTQDFGVYGEVIRDGVFSSGDVIEIL